MSQGVRGFAQWGIIALATYAASFHSAGTSLTRVAPDRVLPRQHVLSTGFWGASGRVWIDGPEQDDFARGKLVSVPQGYGVDVVFDQVLLHTAPEFQTDDLEEQGFLRMVPSLWYGVRADRSDALFANGRAACAGRFYRFTPRELKAPQGWRVESEKRSRISLAIDYPNPAYAGGGIGVHIHEPSGWRLADIGLAPDQEYVVFSDSAATNPLSTWEGGKPTVLKREEFVMDPTVFAEVTDAVLVNDAGERRKVRVPTGWVMAAGHFRRPAGS